MNVPALKSFSARVVVSAVLAALAYIGADISNVASPDVAAIVVTAVTAAIHAVHALAQKNNVDPTS